MVTGMLVVILLNMDVEQLLLDQPMDQLHIGIFVGNFVMEDGFQCIVNKKLELKSTTNYPDFMIHTG